jgi:NRPS condensation-like uncharacterized protein
MGSFAREGSQKMNVFPKRLGAFNQYFWTRELVAANAIIFWAELEGVLEEQALQSALALVQAKYPLLHAKVEKKPGVMPSFVENLTPIELRVVEPERGSDIAQVIETDMAKGSDQCLFRVVLLRYGSVRSTLMFVANHAVTDARGLTFILRDLLRALNGEPLGPPVDAIMTHEELLNEPSMQDFIQTLPPGSPYPATGAAQMKSQRSAFAATEVLHPTEVSAVLNRARDEQTTVQGALMAALAISASGIKTEWRDGRVLQMLVPVDLRRFRPGEESTDLLAHPAFVSIHQKEAGSFWELARTCKRSLDELVTLDAGRAFIRQSHQLLAVEWEPQAFFDATNAGLPHELFMSNLGDVAIPDGYGALRLQKVGFSTLSGPAPTQSICAATFQGWMSLSLVSYQPLEGLLQGMRQLLAEASL